MPKYPIYSEDKARELLRYLPEGTEYLEPEGPFGCAFSVGESDMPFHTGRALCSMATHEANGNLPPGSTAAIAGMVEGRVTRGFENDKLVVIAIEVSK